MLATLVAVLLAALGLTAMPAGAGVPPPGPICSVPGDHATIQAAIDDVGCETIEIAAGTYPESVNLHRAVPISGAGSDDDPASNTVIDATGFSTGIALAADGADVLPLTITGLRVENALQTGISDTSGSDFVTLSDVTSADNGQSGLSLGSGSPGTDDLTLDDVDLIDNGDGVASGVGLRVGSATNVTELTIDGGAFTGNLQGVYIACETSVSCNGSDVSGLTMTGTDLSANGQKGIYAEKLSDATISGVTIDGTGVAGGPAFDSGIDINLKWQVYAGISITDSTIVGTGNGDAANGSAITVKARDDSSYAATPASLSDVTVSGNSIVGNANGIRFGEPKANPADYNDGPTGVVVVDNCFADNVDFAVENVTDAPLDAEGNHWGTAAGPAISDVAGVVDTDPFLEVCPTSEAPGAPTGLAATLDGAEVDLSWTAPTEDGGEPITGYAVYRDGDEIATVTAPTTTYTDDDTEPGATYEYIVRAVNLVGEGPDSNQASATTDAVAPGAPTGLTAVVDADSVDLTWTAPADDGGAPVTGYVVYRDGTELGTSATPSYSDTAAAPGTTYEYTVSAENEAGEGAQSTGFDAGIGSTAPNAPTAVVEDGLEVCLADEDGIPVNGGGPVVTISWSAPAADGGAAITGYTVYRDGDEIGTTAAGELSFVDESADAGTEHSYTVTATNSVGESEQSAPLVVEVQEAPERFSDVSEQHPFFSEICALVELEVTNGYEDGTFKPAAAVTRQAMAAFLYRLAGTDAADPPVAEFSDVSPTHPFFTEIEWLVAEGIAEGYEDDTFRPSRSVSRQAMAAFMYRYAGADAADPPVAEFSDVSRTHPFFTEIEWLADTGLSNGYEDDTFRPSAVVTRQAMAAFLVRLQEV